MAKQRVGYVMGATRAELATRISHLFTETVVCDHPRHPLEIWTFLLVFNKFAVLIGIMFVGIIALCGAAPATVPEVLDAVPVAVSDDNTKSDSKDDSSIKLDLSDFTDAELARLASVRSQPDEEEDILNPGDQASSPISLFVVEENPRITNNEELMSSALTPEEVG
uniref:Uncharacterized protein n=1 Tax=Ditylenchus dipsaci TaxID=166011 RepID=A0A915CVQ4_9BILA